jgi:hypothetical protein
MVRALYVVVKIEMLSLVLLLFFKCIRVVRKYLAQKNTTSSGTLGRIMKKCDGNTHTDALKNIMIIMNNRSPRHRCYLFEVVYPSSFLWETSNTPVRCYEKSYPMCIKIFGRVLVS